MLRDELAEVRLAERRQRQREYVYARRRRVGAGGCATVWCTDVALAIAALDDFNLDLAVRWLLQPLRRGAPLRHGASEAEVRSHMEDRLLAEDHATLLAMATPGASRLNSHGTRIARAFVAECRLANWVEEQNRVTGVPVSNGAAAERFDEILGENEPEANMPAAEYNARRRTSSQFWERNFVRHWRLRRGFAKYGSIRAREPLTLQEKQEKAS